jgi:hypothetical protein
MLNKKTTVLPVRGSFFGKEFEAVGEVNLL